MKRTLFIFFAIFSLLGMIAISGCKKKETYTVTFDANGGTGEMAEQVFIEGEPRALIGNILSYPGYVFKNWNTEKNGTGTSYDDRQRITVTSDMTLYAQWKKIVTFVTVTFDANGGRGEMIPQWFVSGDEEALNHNAFTYDIDGYVFVCWNTMPDGSGNSYTDGQIISITSDMTLYAQWKQIWVDLGLPSGTLWATCNVGATNPEDYGDYFAWGETAPKGTYTWDNYKFNDMYYVHLTKYNNQDLLQILESCDDAAAVNCGADWRMPTYNELTELRNYCTHAWTTLNGVNGRRFVGPNGNSIFLPAAGCRCDGEHNHHHDYDQTVLIFSGNYWSSNVAWGQAIGNGHVIIFDEEGVKDGTVNGVDYTILSRHLGLPVRPVVAR